LLFQQPFQDEERIAQRAWNHDPEPRELVEVKL
jgi:hypothetical protein